MSSTTEKLPILKGILNGAVQYHNAPVRFGRVPKREKARILAAMQHCTNSRSHEKALTAELEDDQRLLNTVVRAHIDTCDFTKDKVEPMIMQARTRPSFTACPPSLACPLNPNPQPLTGQQELLQDFSKRFSPAIRGVVEFAKRITGFSLLPQDDQVTLLKAGVFEVLLVRLACMFDSQTNSMICLNGQVLKRDSIQNSSNARFLMDSMFDFAERLNCLNLSDAEIGLFSSIVVIAPNRPGLRNLELIEKMHNKLKALLQNVLSQNHPNQPNLCQELIMKIPDLRTLNTLHSEKLLAFKMTEQQLQLQQQHHHHHNLWNDLKYKMVDEIKAEDIEDGKSPIGSSSWSSTSDAVAAMDEVKSPTGSVSSTESMCSGEVASLNETAVSLTPPPHHVHHGSRHLNNHFSPSSSLASNAPLLAATLAGGICPMRHRDNSGSDEDVHHVEAGGHHNHNNHHHNLLQQYHHLNGSGSVAPNSSATNTNGGINNKPTSSSSSITCHKIFRKLDSPGDSGIESGTERIEKVSNNSASTSVCSSPRSSSEEKDDHHHHQHNRHNQPLPIIVRTLSSPPRLLEQQYQSSPVTNGHHHQRQSSGNDNATIEDMPVLKRVLQAPPLYDTNSLMDEAYKPHKKFRALRNNKDAAEAEPMTVVASSNANNSPNDHHSQNSNVIISNNTNRSGFNSHRVGSPTTTGLAISNGRNVGSPTGLVIPNGHTSPILSATLTSSSSPSATSSGSSTSPSSPHLQYHLTSSSSLSSLSSTHSTLARSLMEGPRMTPEQMKRTDIIHNYIMRGGADTSFQELTIPTATPHSNNNNNNRCSPPYQHHPYMSHKQQLWEQSIAPSSVITTSSAIRSSATSPRIPSPYSSFVVNNANAGGISPHNHGTVIRSQPSSPSSSSSSSSTSSHGSLQYHSSSLHVERRSPNIVSTPSAIFVRPPNGSPSSSACSPLPSSSLQHYGGVVGSPAASPNNNCIAPNGGVFLNSNYTNSTTHYVSDTSNNSTSSQQPLNLSKKTPPSSPRPLSANSATVGPKIVPLEA